MNHLLHEFQEELTAGHAVAVPGLSQENLYHVASRGGNHVSLVRYVKGRWVECGTWNIRETAPPNAVNLAAFALNIRFAMDTHP